MTNHDTFIDTVREILATRGLGAAEMIAKIESVLPPRPRPTLADMTLDEREACQWMQCDVEGWDDPWLIINPIDDEDHAHVVKRRGNTRIFETKYITPRPDRPRMKWDDNDDTVPPNTLAVGSVWDDADALAQACEESGRDQIIALDRVGNAYVWDEMVEWWEGSAPPIFAPYTIIHTGKKDDQ